MKKNPDTAFNASNNRPLSAKHQNHLAEPDVRAEKPMGTQTQALVRFNQAGKIQWSTTGGHQLLKKAFPEVARGQVPPVVLAWARAEADRMEADQSDSRISCRLQLGKTRCIIIHLHRLPNPAIFEIHLEECATYSLELEGYGLSRREREVLYWISQGKRNSEIGIILGITPKTVNKHAERIFAKLGVETRAGAGNMLLGALGHAPGFIDDGKTESKRQKKPGYP